MSAAAAPVVVYPGGEDEASAMAAMLAGLITANVEQHPERWKDFRALSGTSVWIEVPDIEASLTLTFAGDDLVVRDGRQGRPAVSITADSDVVMALNLVKTGPLGMPNYFDAAGRDVVMALLNRKLRIGGIWRVDTLNRVTRLFSVA
ncbi:MAG: SCP2 sterol-binding domain-containing protein [Candidatus Dormibacteraeota bacterium]|nr:SCP2 sterol-binding domain-containing protein [Candidatus Dormibacteraeota bacterium]